MEAKKTFKIDIKLSSEELKSIIMDYIVNNNEDFKKIFSEENESSVIFITEDEETPFCIVSTTKIK